MQQWPAMPSSQTTRNTKQTLPSPLNQPQADVVIYDGQCAMCRAQVQRLARWDTGRRLAFLSLHDPLVARRYPDLSHDRLMREMVVVDRQGDRRGGADAIRYLSRRLPCLWPLAPLLHVPGSLPIWRLLYRTVARYRYLLGGKRVCEDASCTVHARPREGN